MVRCAPVSVCFRSRSSRLVRGWGRRCPPARRPRPSPGKLTWYGQSCFLLETAAGTRILMDPIPKGIGYELAAGLQGRHRHDQPRALRPQQPRASSPNKPRVIRGLDRRQEGLDARRREGEGRGDPERRRLSRRRARRGARPRHGLHLRGRRRAHRAPRRPRPRAQRRAAGGDRRRRRGAGPRRRDVHRSTRSRPRASSSSCARA